MMARVCASLALAGGFAFVAESTQTAIANGDTRTLSFYHTHTHEKITVTFKRDGRYDPAALKKLNHFLRDWRNDKETVMEPRLFDVVWEVQKDARSTAPIQIISAFRSPETNEKLRSRSRGVAKNSQHTLGRAMDIHLPDIEMSKIREAGLRLQRGGVGFYPTSAKPFVHLDVGNVRHWPRMTRDQLARLFPDGRTVHIPSDGVPLKNYELALSDAARNGATVRGMSGTQLATAVRNQKNSNGSGKSGGGPGLLAKFFGGDEGEDDAPPSAAPVETAAPVAVAAIDQAIPMPAPRPNEVARGPELATAYAPQELPAGPDMIWRSGPAAVAGRAATSYDLPSTTPGFVMPLPRPADTTPSALVASAPKQIQPGSQQPVTASLSPDANLGEARLEAMRLLGMLNDERPASAPLPDESGFSRIASAHDAFAGQQTAALPRPQAPAPAAVVAASGPAARHMPAVEPVAPKSAYSPLRSARNRGLDLNHPQAADRMLAKPSGVLPASFGGNPSMGMRSDLFGGSPVAGLRSLNVGPQRTAQLLQTAY